jgi:pimeloyl-ACP methyl ester carboxylesterase
MIKKWLPIAIGAGVNIIAILYPSLAGRIAYNIFAKPRKGRYKGTKPILDRSIKSTIKHNSIDIQVYEWIGPGKKVLLLHGWESNSARWRNLIDSLLSGGYHVCSIDAPAHGLSGSTQFDAVKYAAFIDQTMQKINADHVVAHSVGGMALMYYLSHYEGVKPEKCVLLGTPSIFRTIMDQYHTVMQYSDRAMLALNEYITIKFGKPIDYYRIENFSKGLTPKALIIHDEGDLVCPFDEGKMIADAWPNAQFLPTLGLGHSYQDKKVYRTIKEFLNA